MMTNSALIMTLVTRSTPFWMPAVQARVPMSTTMIR